MVPGMARPRSILVVGLLGALVWRWCASPSATPATSVGILHTAVLRDGFAIMEADGDRHVVEVDEDGNRRRRRAVPVVTDARVIGTSQGTAVGWLDRKKVKLARVTGDGELGQASEWGRNATALCESAASNDQRFGIGWLESDGRVWFVHGPMSSAVSGVRHSPVMFAGSEAEVMRADWCGITSAGDYIALLWREGSRWFLNMCSKKECTNMVARVPLDPKHALLAFGCTREGCLLAFRDQKSNTNLGWIGVTGKKQWVKPLAQATQSTEVSITAIGKNAMAVGFVSKEGASVLRVSKTGAMERAWADPASTEVPSVAWNKDRLLVAIPEGDKVRHEVVVTPQ